MSHDEKNDEGAQKNVRDNVAEETKEDITDSVAEETKEDITDSVAEETKEDITDSVAEDPGEDRYFTEQAKKLREKADEIVNDDKSNKPKPERIKKGSDTFRQHKINRLTTEKGKGVYNMMTRKPIVTVLIIGAVILVGISLYTLAQNGDQPNKIENSKALWNQSLASLRSGNVSVTEYCNQNPHDQQLCDLYWNLKYM
jgi:hypothetical protein